MAREDATHFLLLNSDIKVKDADWLHHLLSIHRGGITAFGVVENPIRVDGYCLLIDAVAYRAHPLDEGHQWWWAVTKQQAMLLNAGYPVQGYAEHEKFLHHFGGRSGNAFESARGMNVTREAVDGWFAGRVPHVIDANDDGTLPVLTARRPRLHRTLGRAHLLLRTLRQRAGAAMRLGMSWLR